jgi:predicted nucleic acid-binding protein
VKRVFADSFYFFALGNPRDPAHSRAVAFNQSFSGQLITTGWILMELGDGMVLPSQRPIFTKLARQLRSDPDVQCFPCDDALMVAGLDLFGQRLDKEWSLTDCISFVLMQREGVTEALTGDRHFEQAGFVALLK